MAETSQTPKSLKAQITRTSLVLAAEALLREQGPKAVTYRKVAKWAGAASSSVGYYFDSVTQLLHEAGRYNIQLWAERAEKAAVSYTHLLVKDCVASRIHAKDASLYDFSEEARACSEQYMGWTDLASNSPYSLRDIQNFADSIIAQGLKTVVLIGQGGSTQAPMTITKYNKPDSSRCV